MSAPGARCRPGATDPLLAGQIRRALAGGRIGRDLQLLPVVGSTNDVAHQLGRQGAVDGTLVVADRQTAGRGRRRRHWISPAGKGLYLSVVLRPGAGVGEAGAAVQLAAGVAVAETVRAHSPVAPRLRWPNDCYCGEGKVAGVLVEAGATGRRLDFLVCGIGLNVNHEASDFPTDLERAASSLRIVSGHTLRRLPILVDLVRGLDRWEGVWRRHGFGPIRERWLELSPETRGGDVEVLTDDGRVVGRADGLSESGALRVQVGDGVREIHVGEVVRLTRAGC